MQLSSEQQNLLIRTAKETEIAAKTAQNAYALVASIQQEIKQVREQMNNLVIPKQNPTGQLTLTFEKPLPQFQHQFLHDWISRIIADYGLTGIQYSKLPKPQENAL